jgi:tetratricopeptide (TPR) repeat protein
MNDDAAQKAVSAALSGNWEEAIKLNQAILEKESRNIDALNRLARALAETGNFKKAREYSKRVLEIDPLNSIAKKSLKKWAQSKGAPSKEAKSATPSAFLEEPGKTKMVALIHLGDKKIIASLDSGDEINLDTHKRRVSVSTKDGEYVGRLTDDLSARLRELIKHGNEYEAFIKSVDTEERDTVTVFIRETKRASKLSDIPSFTSEKIDFVSLERT